ncbi:MAG: proton-conducting transporter membrane subunit [Elusimicrobiota bacterium]|jgi:formate hydrogenlyase subunit 3/multisubunit Na+/H+ antiporter MnhD subunit
MILLSMGIFVLGGILALCAGRSARAAAWLGAGGAVLGALVGLVPVLHALTGASIEPLRLAWGLPIGSFSIGLDPLSAFFAVPMLVLCALCALYGAEYMRPYAGSRNLGVSWFWFDLLCASMFLVLIARDGMLFLIAWELMSLSSYFLVSFEDEKESVRQAGWTYLVAAHLGTAALFLFFMLLAREGGSADFSAVPALPAKLGAAAFLLALAGFGTKAGFIPMHVWLPEAHPAAPSHVSALMSGAMIKTGVYGLVRALTLLGAPPAWWGWTLLCVGAVSGVLGVLFALAQRDIKRLLAYSSIENMGIIALGLGLGLLGKAHGEPLICMLGFGGALLHALNHSLFKGLLFLGAGSVLHAAGTRDMEHLGGLFKRMPWTGTCFLAGSAAICGLPPLNGFISEFMIFLAAFHAVVRGYAAWGAPAIAALALIGGLALACFTKAFGIVFLGEPRTQGSRQDKVTFLDAAASRPAALLVAHMPSGMLASRSLPAGRLGSQNSSPYPVVTPQRAAQAHEAGPLMRLSMAVLVCACFFLGLGGALAMFRMREVLSQATGLRMWDFMTAFEDALIPLHSVSACAAVLLLMILSTALLRALLLKGREVRSGLTWDCGYAAPNARMQYTASSFVQPVTELFSAFLRTRERAVEPKGNFPAAAAFATETPDAFREDFYRPVFESALKAAWKLRRFQHGRIQLYILYIALTLMVLLIWKLGVH